jgi:hypothetical protein
MRKVLQSETWSLSDGVHRKRRRTREEQPRDIIIIILEHEL